MGNYIRCLTQDLNEELQKYFIHERKVSFINFNPIYCDIIVSVSFDNIVHV